MAAGLPRNSGWMKATVSVVGKETADRTMDGGVTIVMGAMSSEQGDAVSNIKLY